MKYLFQLAMMGLIGVFLNSNVAYSQDEQQKKWSLDGYLTNMQSVMIPKDSLNGDWIADNYLHNRLNFQWYPTKSLTASIQMRNRFVYGESVKYGSLGNLKQSISDDPGLVDLNFAYTEGNSYAMSAAIDRLWLKYTLGKFEATLGRQRINWGQTYAFNPNDIFNTYSFFEVDYEERPGSDAMHLQYYTGMASSVELAMKADDNENITAAGLVKLNKWNYDFQFMGGYYNSSDIVAGLGWNGYAGGAGVRGEATYLHPAENVADTSGLLLISAGSDYTFSNSLYIMVEGMYSSIDKDNLASIFSQLSSDRSVKQLAFANYTILTQVSYPVNPLLNASLSGMFFAGNKGTKVVGYFVGPSISYSLSNNADLSLIGQRFAGKFPEPITGTVVETGLTMVYLKLKYNF